MQLIEKRPEQWYQNPLSGQYSNILLKIYNGKHEDSSFNIEKSVEIGQEMMIDFQESLPDGFREKHSSRLVTMSEVKIKKRIAEAKPVYNT